MNKRSTRKRRFYNYIYIYKLYCPDSQQQHNMEVEALCVRLCEYWVFMKHLLSMVRSLNVHLFIQVFVLASSCCSDFYRIDFYSADTNLWFKKVSYSALPLSPHAGLNVLMLVAHVHHSHAQKDGKSKLVSQLFCTAPLSIPRQKQRCFQLQFLAVKCWGSEYLASISMIKS